MTEADQVVEKFETWIETPIARGLLITMEQYMDPRLARQFMRAAFISGGASAFEICSSILAANHAISLASHERKTS